MCYVIELKDDGCWPNDSRIIQFNSYEDAKLYIEMINNKSAKCFIFEYFNVNKCTEKIINDIKFNVDIQNKINELNESIYSIKCQISTLGRFNNNISNSDVKYAMSLIDQNMQEITILNMQEITILTKEFENMETLKQNLENQIKPITFEE